MSRGFLVNLLFLYCPAKGNGEIVSKSEGELRTLVVPVVAPIAKSCCLPNWKSSYGVKVCKESINSRLWKSLTVRMRLISRRV